MAALSRQMSKIRANPILEDCATLMSNPRNKQECLHRPEDVSPGLQEGRFCKWVCIHFTHGSGNLTQHECCDGMYYNITISHFSIYPAAHRESLNKFRYHRPWMNSTNSIIYSCTLKLLPEVIHWEVSSVLCSV